MFLLRPFSGIKLHYGTLEQFDRCQNAHLLNFKSSATPSIATIVPCKYESVLNFLGVNLGGNVGKIKGMFQPNLLTLKSQLF